MSSASASATEHRHRQQREPDTSATETAAKGTRAWGLPDWDVIEPLARFWTHYPSERHPRLRNFLENAVACGQKFHAPNRCADAEEWVVLVFSSAAIAAARRRRGEAQPEPMGHFTFHISRMQRRELDARASVNIGMLERVLEDLDVPLASVLEEGERENPALRVPALHDRLRALDYFLDGWVRSRPVAPPRVMRLPAPAAPRVAVESSAPRETPRSCAPIDGWSPKAFLLARRDPVLSHVQAQEILQRARCEAERAIPVNAPCRADVVGMKTDELVRVFTRAALEELRLVEASAAAAANPTPELRQAAG